MSKLEKHFEWPSSNIIVNNLVKVCCFIGGVWILKFTLVQISRLFQKLQDLKNAQVLIQGIYTIIFKNLSFAEFEVNL
jgi:hypothetical protein